MATESASAIGHASSWGYACFLTVNATSVWGGIFPFLPLGVSDGGSDSHVLLTQAVAFWRRLPGEYAGIVFLSLRCSAHARLAFRCPAIPGSACLITAMYVASAAIAFVGAGGVLLGIGCAGMFMLWQRYFASLDARTGNFRLIVGTAIAPFIYLALYLVPIALTAFLVPLIFVPLCGLCVALSVREMNFEQPMFEDVPRQHPRVYRQVVADYWRSALCVGSLALVAGVIRESLCYMRKLARLSTARPCLVRLLRLRCFLVLWHRMSFRFGLISVFRVVYPLLTLGFLLMPFCGLVYLNAFAAVAYMVFFPCADAHDDAVRPGLPRSWYQSCVHLRVLWGYRLYFAKRRLPFLAGASELTVPAGSSGCISWRLSLAADWGSRSWSLREPFSGRWCRKAP